MHCGANAFAFEPGVTVTNRAQIKGLEFDAVVVFEPTESDYPAQGDEGRRRLYTVLTRAKSELVLIASDEPTELLARAIEQGSRDVADAATVPEFSGADDEPF